MKFNSKDLPAFVRLVGREITALPGISVNSMELPRQLGSSFLYTKLGSKKEALQFILIPTKVQTVDSATTEFATWLRGDNFKPSKIEFTDKAGVYSMAQVNGSVTVSDLFLYGTLTVEFLYTDPLTYSNTTINRESVFPISVAYTGEVPQPPVVSFVVVGTATKLELRNSMTSKRITLNGTFATGTQVVIDMQKKLIKLNGIVNMKVLSLDSEWSMLEKGTNSFTLYQNNAVKTGNSVLITSKVANY